MNPQTTHPPQDVLEAFLGGRLDPSSDDSINRHVSGCDSCCVQLEKICQGDDEFFGKIVEIGSNLTINTGLDRTLLDGSQHVDVDAYVGDDPHVPGEGSRAATQPLGERVGPDDHPVADSTSNPLNGQRYRFAHELGRGGMGIVYAGYDGLLERDLVLKVLNPTDQDNPEAVRRFLAEARICGSLQHPGVVPIHDMGRLHDERPFFSMKRVEGKTLCEWLASRNDPTMDQARFLSIFTQVCQTIAYAHSQQVIHRDLKPANIMIGAFGEVQVLDWGLAKQLGQTCDRGEARHRAAINSSGPALDAPTTRTNADDNAGPATVDGDPPRR